MKKGVALGLFFAGLILIWNLCLVSSANETTPFAGSEADAITRAYQCLEAQVKDRTQFSLQQALFSTLALGSKGNVQTFISGEKKGSEACWPKSGCSIRDTAQVLLAYQRSGKGGEDIERWLLSKNVTSSELTWHLEIDIANQAAATCTIGYDGQKRTVKIQSDMRIGDNGAANCFSISPTGYWLQIRNSCLDKNFEISCDQDFITSLLYERGSGGTVYVVSESHSSASLGTTSEQVRAQCFKSGSGCDYEGSLWAALALYKTGHDVNAFIPYLLALSENNQRYFPSAFLYLLTGSDDQYSSVVQLQKQAGYWELIASPYNRYYDTGLGMLALGSGSSGAELTSTKEYLLNVQGRDGCWNNRDSIIDTSFILYAGWPKATTQDGGDGGSTPYCEEVQGQSCEIGSECLDAGGRILNNFACSGFGVCCSIKVEAPSCSQKGGIVCESNEQCSGSEEPSSDGACCVGGSCTLVEQSSSCELAGGRCASVCDSEIEEEDTTQSCPAGGVCCMQIIEPESGSNKTLIIILAILIALLIIAILARHKLQIWWFNFRHKGKSGGLKPAGPPSYGPPANSRAPPRLPPPGYRPMARTSAPVARKGLTEKEKEMEETLKKIREMGK